VKISLQELTDLSKRALSKYGYPEEEATIILDMLMYAQMRGNNLAMQTPMHADGSIDYARWEELIELYIDAGVHYMPRESVRLFELVASDDIAGAMELWSRMIPSLLCIWRGNYVPKVKAASRQRGFDGGGVRAPLQNLSVDEARELAACLEPLG